MDTMEMARRNPFLDEYLNEELEFYGRPQGIRWARPMGRVNDYLNVNFRLEGPECPILVEDGTIWMSLTWMEVQSMWAPLVRAKGRVGTSGLGLGYFALRAAMKPEVSEVVVCEKNPQNIGWFKDQMSNHEGFKKLTIVEGDVREMKGEKFDFFFADHYPTLLPDEVIEDCDLIQEKNEIEDYRFWGYERVVFDAIEQDLIDPMELDGFHHALLNHWMASDLCDLRRNHAEESYVFDVLQQMDWRI